MSYIFTEDQLFIDNNSRINDNKLLSLLLDTVIHPEGLILKHTFLSEIEQYLAYYFPYYLFHLRINTKHVVDKYLTDRTDSIIVNKDQISIHNRRIYHNKFLLSINNNRYFNKLVFTNQYSVGLRLVNMDGFYIFEEIEEVYVDRNLLEEKSEELFGISTHE